MRRTGMEEKITEQKDMKAEFIGTVCMQYSDAPLNIGFSPP